MTLMQLKEKMLDAGIHPDSIGRDREGNFVARWGFFYTHGRTSSGCAAQVKTVFPEAQIIDDQKIWKRFRGSASVANSSHFLVRFTL